MPRQDAGRHARGPDGHLRQPQPRSGAEPLLAGARCSRKGRLAFDGADRGRGRALRRTQRRAGPRRRRGRRARGAARQVAHLRRRRRPSNARAIAVLDEQGAPSATFRSDEEITIAVDYSVLRPLPSLRILVTLTDGNQAVGAAHRDDRRPCARAACASSRARTARRSSLPRRPPRRRAARPERLPHRRGDPGPRLRGRRPARRALRRAREQHARQGVRAARPSAGGRRRPRRSRRRRASVERRSTTSSSSPSGRASGPRPRRRRSRTASTRGSTTGTAPEPRELARRRAARVGARSLRRRPRVVLLGSVERDGAVVHRGAPPRPPARGEARRHEPAPSLGRAARAGGARHPLRPAGDRGGSGPALRERAVFAPLPADGDFEAARRDAVATDAAFTGGGADRDFAAVIEAVRGTGRSARDRHLLAGDARLRR